MRILYISGRRMQRLISAYKSTWMKQPLMSVKHLLEDIPNISDERIKEIEQKWKTSFDETCDENAEYLKTCGKYDRCRYVSIFDESFCEFIRKNFPREWKRDCYDFHGRFVMMDRAAIKFDLCPYGMQPVDED